MFTGIGNAMERIGARTKSNHGLGLDGDITGGPAWAASSSAVHHPPVRLVCHTTDELTYLTARAAEPVSAAPAYRKEYAICGEK